MLVSVANDWLEKKQFKFLLFFPFSLEGEKKCWTKFSSESDPTLLSSTAGAGNQTAAQGNDSLKDDDSVS